MQATLHDLSLPLALDFDAKGRLFIADSGRDRIAAFDGDGGALFAFGTRGSGAGQLRRPAGVACAPDGRIWVSDTGNHRVQAFDDQGQSLSTFGRRGRGPSELCEPAGLAVDEERVWVADSGNARVSVFALDGTPLLRLELPCDERGLAGVPRDVTLDGEGGAFVLDERAARVLRIDRQGTWTNSFAGRGDAFGLCRAPAALDRCGERLFVADTLNHRVQEFDPGGRFHSAFPNVALTPRQDGAGVFAPAGLAVSHRGDRVALAEPCEDRVQVFAEAPAHEQADAHGAHSGLEGSVARFAAGADCARERLAVVDPERAAVTVFDVSQTQPVAIARVGDRAGEGEPLVAPRGVAVDRRTGWIHVSDPPTARVVTFRVERRDGEGLEFSSTRGERLRALALDAPAYRDVLPALAWPFAPGPLASGPDGDLAVADERNACVVLLDERGKVRACLRAAGAQEFLRPVHVAFDASGERLYVTDADAARVFVLAARPPEVGALLSTWGDAQGSAALLRPVCALPEADGALVLDGVADRVVAFDAAGAARVLFGASGTNGGQMHHATDLLGGPGGVLYLIDSGNRRGQTLERSGRFLVGF